MIIVKASELAFMLQTIGPHEDPNIRKDTNGSNS